jgi:hypothetical protein
LSISSCWTKLRWTNSWIISDSGKYDKNYLHFKCRYCVLCVCPFHNGITCNKIAFTYSPLKRAWTCMQVVRIKKCNRSKSAFSVFCVTSYIILYNRWNEWNLAKPNHLWYSKCIIVGFPNESSYDITPVAYIAANSSGIFVEKNVIFLLFSFLRPLYYSRTPSLNNECC